MREYGDLHIVIEDCEILYITDKGGVLCLIEGEKHWLPQSQIHENSECWETGDKGELIISRWIAERRGLI